MRTTIFYFVAVALLAAAFTSSARAQGAPPLKVKVLKENVNLRARPALSAEVIGQVGADQELIARSMDAEWVEVVAPTNIDFWVLGDYLKDGVIVCNQKVNVRAGPGINFNAVGQLNNETRVEVRGRHEDWIRIAPSENCSLWVARSLVEVAAAPPSLPKISPPRPPAAPLPRAEARKPERTEPAKPALLTNAVAVSPPAESRAAAGPPTAGAPPKDLELIPDIAQGQWQQYAGVLRPKNFLVRSPADFRLVAPDAAGRAHTVCFIKGNRAQLAALLDRELVIQGRQYWVQRHRSPVLVPEKIILK